MSKMKKTVNRKKKKQLQLIAILLMLLLIAAALTWLTLRGRAMNRARTTDATKTLESAVQAVTGGRGHLLHQRYAPGPFAGERLRAEEARRVGNAGK